MKRNKILFFILLLLFMFAISFYIHYLNLLSTIALPSFSLDILNTYGDWYINTIELCYIPVRPEIQKLMQTLSRGKIIPHMKSQGFDQPMHVYLTLSLSNPMNENQTERIIIEKNETIYIFKESEKQKYQIVVSDSKDTNCQTAILNLDNVEPKITLSDLIEQTKEIMGKQFYIYDCAGNNCQRLALNILDILKKRDIQFETSFDNNINQYKIFQPSEELLKDFPRTRKVAKLITDTLRIITFFKDTSS
jgi:hypothetical protein